MRQLFALLAGSLFGSGLYVSGMTDTSKVQGWLDIFGAWDPTLAFVMGGAMLPMALAWAVARKRRSALLGTAFPPAPSTQIDSQLILGSVLFGLGWGLAGLCPGPSIAALSYGGPGLLVFIVAMGVGMLAAPTLRRRLTRPQPAQ